MGLEALQEAIQKSKYGLTNYPKWLREGPRSTIDYIDLILDQESKLSSIITCCQWESTSVPIMGKQKCTTPREKTCAYEGGTVISSPPC